MSKKCFHCFKIALVIINFTLFLIGISILGSSLFLYAKTTNHDLIRARDHYSEFIKILSSIMGAAIFTIVVSLIGCFGAYRESQLVLAVYFTVTLLLFASEVAMGALYLVYKDDKLATNLRISIDDYKVGKSTKQEELFLDSVQKMLKCCGVENSEDYKVGDKASKVLSLPLSCCDYEKAECVKSQPIDKTKAFTKGCKEQYKEFSQHKLGIVSMIIIVMSIIELLGMILSIALCFTIRYIDNNGYMAIKRSMVV